MAARPQQGLQPPKPATAADLADIYALNRACFREAWSRQALQDALAAGLDMRVWRTDAGELAAYWLAQIVAGEVHILQLAVAPAWRRCGIGSTLTRLILAEMQCQGVRQAFLEVREGNLAARRMYRRLGFDEIGRRRGYYVDADGHIEDALVMAKSL